MTAVRPWSGEARGRCERTRKIPCTGAAVRLVCVDGTDELEKVYRQEATQIRAALAARLGDVGLAEELVQDAFIEALEHWATEGMPPNPGGWLATTARRKAIDRLRRERAGQEKLALLAVTQSRRPGPGGRPGVPADLDSAAAEVNEDDDLLSLVFACCHPSLQRESQIALTLRAVCGLTAPEISAAFLNEVLAVIYLVFNEGYLASAGRTPARRDLAAQAIALNRLLHRLMPREPEVLGLLALLLLHESRAATRFDGWGRLVRLQDQDRSRWDTAVATEAAQLLGRAIEMHRPGPYQIQAAIAAVHAQAPTYEQTDWHRIRSLYDRLDLLAPSPVVRLNRAVATRFAIGPEAALREVEPLAAELDGYRLFHAVRAELLNDLGCPEQARAANERALALAANPAERELLARRLSL